MDDKYWDNRLNRIEAKIDKLEYKIDSKIDLVNDRVDSVDKTLVAQHGVLADHIRRTEILEEQVAPLTKDAMMWAGAGKVLAVMTALAAIATALYKIFA